ncbi:Hsp20/alpha crystallin family protein [Geobacter sp. DSM 9736]|uniref:Hsp20/alpha crystallin family protein n=1 Tax=Geobacter sp. DSM 9736 TaxID=1277350 RepID=UPI000B506190|nr:Hsp20/alpha crystallin family protein [Geobacter sp. DSM 9736]SNB48013.1 HSP20 family protein [Geobacter sp. DSM 9736]
MRTHCERDGRGPKGAAKVSVTGIIHPKPNSSLTTAFEEMEKLVEETLHMPVLGWHRMPLQRFFEDGPGEYVPDLDVYDEGSEIVVKVDLPGMKREEIDVQLIDGTLVISGEKKGEDRCVRREYLRMERRNGNFRRSLRLPDSIDGQHVSASLKDGVLEVRVPKVYATVLRVDIR